MRKWLSSRGASAGVVVVALLLLALIAAGIYFVTRRGLPPGSAFDLASYLPKSSKAVWMLNLQGQLEIEKLKADWDDVAAKIPTEQKKKLDDDFRKEFGLSFTELLALFDGRAALAAIVDPAGKPGAVGLLGLRDAAGFEKLIKDKLASGTKAEVGGVSFTFGPDGPGMGHDSTWIYLADSKQNAELLLAAVGGKETLATDPIFLEAKGKVAGEGSLTAAYWDIASSVKAAQSLNPPYTDAQTFKDLGCLQYAVGSLDLRAGQSNAFLKVADDKSSLSSKLLSKGSVNATSFGALTENTDSGHAIDLEWTFNSVVALMMLSPESREAAGMASMGLAFVGNPFTAFEGEVAFTNDAMKLLTTIFSDNFGVARTQGQTTACQSNLKNIATGLEMYSTDFSGRYPGSLDLLTPNYLKTIPDCPAAGKNTYSQTYKVGQDPDTYSFACSGNNHQQASDNLPAYDSNTGLIAAVSPSAEEPAFVPSVVVTATVKDIKMAHALLAKALPDSGAEPKPGEEKDYGIPGGSLKMTTGTPPRLIFTYGSNADPLLDTKGGTLADKPRLNEALAWGKDGIIYADYMNLRPAMEALEKAIPDDKSEEAEMGRVVLAKMKELDLEGASCLSAQPDGLHWRAYGSSGGAAVGAVGAVGAAVLVPNFIKARAQGQTTACKSNLKNIGTALEMYSTDWSGKYPTSLDTLTPNYLRTIPECPAAGSMTYKAHFGPKAKGNTEGYADYYYVECAGSSHEDVGIPADYPAFSSITGLLEGSY